MTELVANELTQSNSDASSLTSENSDDIFHQSPDNLTTWTNEKHNLYLDHLEVSFVEQLQQSVGFHSSRSEQKSDKHLSRKWNSDVNIASDQLTVLQNGRHVCNQCPPASAVLQESLVLCSTAKHIAVERIVSQGFKTCSQQLPASNIYTGDTSEFVINDSNSTSCMTYSPVLLYLDFWEENVFKFCSQPKCSGQNFVDEDSQDNSYNGSRAKRLKTALADNSSNDQIVPSYHR